MFRELVEHNVNNRGKIVPVGEIFPTPSNFCRYCSHFMFGTDIEAYVKTHPNEKGNPSVSGFKGKVYCEAVWIDIDCDTNTDEARVSAFELCKRLNGDYGIDPNDLFIYFSGNKGFHIAIHNSFVGFSHTTPIQPDKVKDFVRRLTVGLLHIDTKIYDPVRIFRIENSQHEKSKLYKIRISFNELQCDISDIKNLAKNPRKYEGKVNITSFKTKDALNRLWNNSGNYVQEQREFEHNGNLFQPPKEGNRNNTLLIQACTLFRKSELSSNAILDIISNAAHISSMGAKDPISQTELKRLVANAERLVGDEKKKVQVDDLQMRSFGEWIPEWENYVLQEQTNMSLCFREINETMRGRLRGKLFVLMGYGGAKKSLYALNIILRNKRINENDVSIYSTMEMSVPHLMNRIIDHEAKSTDGRNAHELAAEIIRKDLNEGRKYMIGQLGESLGNKLQIISNSRMTYEYYKKAIQQCRETIGNPSMLVVDGLSMMGGKGTETEVYSQNSADLKQLANEENILVILICHVSKGADRHTRDLSRNIRGSEKILDNCDFYATLSQIQDADNPEIYRQDIGFIDFVDKRGTGKTIDIIYSFESARLKMTDSPYNAADFYEPVKKLKKTELDF